MPIELHTWNTPNGRKISVALEEMGLPYTVHPINISKGDQFAPAFLEISPNNRIPAIVDPEGPGGAPISIFESGAILIYLGEKTGKFWPRDLRHQVPVLEWLMWQMGGFGPMPGQVHHFLTVADENDRRYGLDRYTKETRRLYGVLDKRLGAAEFAGGDISIADFADPRLGVAARAASRRPRRFPQRQALVRDDDGPPGHQARLRGGVELTCPRFKSPCRGQSCDRAEPRCATGSFRGRRGSVVSPSRALRAARSRHRAATRRQAHFWHRNSVFVMVAAARSDPDLGRDRNAIAG